MNEKAPSEKDAKQKMQAAGVESSLPAMPSMLDICQIALYGCAILMCWIAGKGIIRHRSMSITLHCIKSYTVSHSSSATVRAFISL